MTIPNRIEKINEETFDLIITNRKGEEFHSWFSLEDYEFVTANNWCMDGKGKGYVMRASRRDADGKQQSIRLHREIALRALGENPPDKPFPDHRNNNRLDNRRFNLRWCSTQENNRNKSKHRNNTSGIPGVNWDKRYQKWRAYITVNRKQIHLGYFLDEDDAINTRRAAAIKYFGEFYNEDY